MQKSAVVLLSGGMDSTTLYWDLLHKGRIVHALSVNYGQRHNIELQAASSVVKEAAKVWPELVGEHEVIDMTNVRRLLSGSSQTSDGVAVPHGHYAEETMKATVVPNRNMVLIALAAGWAVSLKAEVVGVAAHAGDHAIYPDCREEFLTAMDKALAVANYEPVELYAPFVHMSKTEIAKFGATIGVPYRLTYSCYEGKVKHCRKCGTCVERAESFKDAGLMDPTSY